MLELKPKPGWVLVRRRKDPGEVHGFIVPDVARDRRLGPGSAYQAEVVMVGDPGFRYEHNRKSGQQLRWCDPDIARGDAVIVEAMSYHPYGDMELVRCEDVIATLHGADLDPIVLAGHQPYMGEGAKQL